MSKVIDFPNQSIEISPDKVLEGAIGTNFESIMIIGWEADGRMYTSTSNSNTLEDIATLDIARSLLITNMFGDGE